jgi:hypothetical protein
MPDIPPITQADLDREAEGTEKAAQARERFFAVAPGGACWRDLLAVASGGPATTAEAVAGRHLISRRPTDLQHRYDTFLAGEERFPEGPEVDYALLINYACALLEAEVDVLLVRPAREIAGPLLAAAGRASPDLARFLEPWAGGRSAPSLGTASLVLSALRCGRGDTAIEAFLESHFEPEFTEQVCSNRFVPHLDFTREHFRNPACHASRTFGAHEYDRFARRLVGHLRVGYWEAEGPLPSEPPDEDALLHRLLTGSRLLPDVELPPPPVASDELRRPLERLTALARPRADGLEIAVAPAHSEGDPQAPAREVRPFRLGDEITFLLRARDDCHVVVIDIGTTGDVAAVLPSRWFPSPRLAAGRTHHLPGAEFPGFTLRLGGLAGRERVVALATRAPLRVPLRPQGRDAFRPLDAPTLEAVVEAVAQLNPADWGAAVCDFAIVPR